MVQSPRCLLRLSDFTSWNIELSFSCAGAAGYSYGSGGSHSSDGEDATPTTLVVLGIAFMVCSVFSDAIIPNYQKLLLNQGVPVTQLMINVNTIGAVTSLAYIVVTGQLFALLGAWHAHPELLFYLTCVGVSLSIAVWAYTKLIQATSSVVAVAVSTLRKVATMFLSYIIFPKPLLTIHIYSGCMVLLGVILSTVAKERMDSKK
ncbi:Solute carrier family 35, member B3 [Seminavis robusta]|uniref:Solute carrier family 35, member B3 n=1 Tax=Seminavis robusta TaxID=568900 RepID=A0A9N8HPJ1_9STRA|nr:Solute carrier family 35, member B3 [Seminavis robusta]|eukprot:Sro906_g218620.1 Solute carrier family 35, member B3 (204) ;mRNA; r:24565-25176